MAWLPVDSKAELDALDGSVCWEDSNVLEFHAAARPGSYYPADIDICRSGHRFLDLHILIGACARSPYLELAFVACEHMGINAATHIHLSGTIDTLKRVEVVSYDGAVVIRAARLLYRWLEEVPLDGTYYTGPQGPDPT
jgi:hypothetical protein